MPAELVIPHRLYGNIPAQPQEIKQVGAHIGHHRNPPIDDIVPCIMDKQEHQQDANSLKSQRNHGNIRIFFQGRIQPAYPGHIQENSSAHYQKERPVLCKFRNHIQRCPKHNIDQGGHHGIDAQYFLHRPGKLLLVIPDLGAGTDAISRDTQHGKHGKICDHCSGSINFPIPRRKQYPGHIGESYQRENK